jgi:hypothetical protein
MMMTDWQDLSWVNITGVDVNTGISIHEVPRLATHHPKQSASLIFNTYPIDPRRHLTSRLAA